jgi:hypothetical protein
VCVLNKTDSNPNAVGFKGNAAEKIDGANTKRPTTQYAAVRVRAKADASGALSW